MLCNVWSSIQLMASSIWFFSLLTVLSLFPPHSWPLSSSICGIYLNRYDNPHSHLIKNSLLKFQFFFLYLKQNSHNILCTCLGLFGIMAMFIFLIGYLFSNYLPHQNIYFMKTLNFPAFVCLFFTCKWQKGWLVSVN